MFALPLAFNLSCRMERLFKSSITRKCPLRGEQRRRGTRAREAGYLDNTPPPAPPPFIFQPVVSAAGQRTLESQEVLRGKSPHAVNPLIYQLGLAGSLRLLSLFYLQ